LLSFNFRLKKSELKEILSVKFKQKISSILILIFPPIEKVQDLYPIDFSYFHRTYEFIRLNVLSSQCHPPTNYYRFS
jgi:hypothetical protein